MKRTVIVNCQVYEKDEDEFPKLQTSGKEFRIELDEELIEDENTTKEVLTSLVDKKETNSRRYEYFNHEIQDYTIEKLSTEKEFLKAKINLYDGTRSNK